MSLPPRSAHLCKEKESERVNLEKVSVLPPHAGRISLIPSFPPSIFQNFGGGKSACLKCQYRIGPREWGGGVCVGGGGLSLVAISAPPPLLSRFEAPRSSSLARGPQ